MGLFDGVFDLFGSAVSGLLGESDATGVGGSGTYGASSLSVNYPPYQPQSFPEQPAYPVMSSMPAVMGGVARWASQFPNLWQAVQRLRANYRVPMSVDKLWSMLRSSGPQFLVSLIGAAALNELFVYRSTHKSRRMNVANTKALRRSVRRLKGFDRLSHRVSSQLSRVGGGGRRRSSSRRCGTCRKSPCAC